MRQHKKVDDTTMRYLIQTEQDSEFKSVDMQFIVKGKDPLKDIGTAELKVDDKFVIGIDIDGDCFQLIQ